MQYEPKKNFEIIFANFFYIILLFKCIRMSGKQFYGPDIFTINVFNYKINVSITVKYYLKIFSQLQVAIQTHLDLRCIHIIITARIIRVHVKRILVMAGFPRYHMQSDRYSICHNIILHTIAIMTIAFPVLRKTQYTILINYMNINSTEKYCLVVIVSSCHSY